MAFPHTLYTFAIDFVLGKRESNIFEVKCLQPTSPSVREFTIGSPKLACPCTAENGRIWSC
jgi:hypothetical protein